MEQSRRNILSGAHCALRTAPLRLWHLHSRITGIMKALSNMTALFIEPHAGMRGSLHNMLNLCEITKIDHAGSSGTAIRPLQNKNYDIILCEYDLVDGL